MDVGAITRFLHCITMDVGAITRFLHCMRWMWVQLLRFSLYVMDVGAITSFHIVAMDWVFLGFYIVCERCGCNY